MTQPDQEEFVHSVNLLEYVYVDGIPGADDAAENYFEASKLYRDSLPWDTPGVPILIHSRDLQQISSQRAGRRYASRRTIPLPAPEPLSADLAEVLTQRRNAPEFGGGELSLATLAGVLQRSYGLQRQPDGQDRRATPSGGALYPLDIFVFARRVEGLTPGIYHFDPYRSVLAEVGGVDFEAFDDLTLIPEVARDCSASLVVSASFWRSRFKYSQRSLRFVFIEAGHLAQNALLLATGYGLACRLFGGFIDNELTAMLPDHNGVDDAPIYMVLLGTRPDSAP